MGRIATFVGRSHTEKKLFLTALFLVPLVRIGLMTVGYRRVRAFLEKREEARVSGKSALIRDQVVWAVGSVSKKFIVDKPCLTQSLVLCYLLRRRGYDPEMKIGVRKTDSDGLEAHAWVEHDGAVISGGRRSPEIFSTLVSADAWGDV